MTPSKATPALAFVALFLPCFVTGASSQTPTLVRDINQKLDPRVSSSPGGFVNLGAWTYFVATTPGEGLELWRTDGTEAGTTLVVDLYPGPQGSNPSFLTVFGNRLLFGAKDPTYGKELWSSDGTAAGTQLVKDIMPGALESAPWGLVSIGSLVLFRATDGTSGLELWATDGTPQGTRLVRDIHPGGHSNPDRFVAAGSTALFLALEPATGVELWKSDGTLQGTTLVADIVPGTGSPWINQLTLFGQGVVFEADISGLGREPWISDGTAAGTRLIADLMPGAQNSYPRSFFAFGGFVLFQANTQGTFTPTVLWRTDGTTQGTLPLAGPLTFEYPTVLGNEVFFAGSGATGTGVWKTDGTAAGTVLVASVATPRALVTAGNRVFFEGHTVAAGYELWTCDGSAQGATLVRDIWPSVFDGRVKWLHDAGGFLLFSAHDGQHGEELWRSDGTTAGTALVADLTPNPQTQYANPDWMAEHLGLVYFSADDGILGAELWVTDGTSAGTRLVRDVETGEVGSEPRLLRSVGPNLFFSANTFGFGRRLWRSDGTAQGTFMLPGPNATDPNDLTPLGDLVVFTAFTGSRRLWRSDGTTAGTFQIGGIGSDAYPVLAAGGLVYVVTSTALWVTDGTAARMVKSLGYPQQLTWFGDAVYFFATDPLTGRELWKTDGTAQGTVLVADSVPGPTGFGYAGPIKVADDRMFFVAEVSGVSGFEPWTSDGTAAGTRLLLDTVPGPQQGAINMTAVGDHAFFQGYAGGEGLWVSDGTTAGTRKLLACTFGYGLNMTAAGTRLGCFMASSSGTGTEPWVTDGTPAGTLRLGDLMPGPGDSNPNGFVRLRGKLLFAATSDAWGRELFAVDLGATAQPIGAPCGRSLRAPWLRASDPVLGGNLELQGRGAFAPALGVLLLGGPPAAWQPSGNDCVFHLAPAPLALIGVIATTGSTFGTTLPIPLDPSLSGIVAAVQAVFLGTDAPQGFDESNGIALRFY